MHWDQIRIINPWVKASAIAVWFAASVALGLVWPSRLIAATILWMMAALAVNYGLTRIFRVREEPIIHPRAWWRATGRPTAGYVIGGLSALSVAFLLIPDLTGVSAYEDALVSAVGNAATAVFYLHSSIRLARLPADRTVLPMRSSDV